jgi:hypothetical protein
MVRDIPYRGKFKPWISASYDLEVMTAHGKREVAQKDFLYNGAYQIDPHKLLAPLPAEQILINSLTQNPGY